MLSLFAKSKPVALYKKEIEDKDVKKHANPGRGFYSIFPFDLTNDIDKDALSTSIRSDQELVLVEIDLSAYRDSDLDEYAKNRLHDIMSFFRSKKKDMIIRFCYDLIGHAVDSEPESITRVISHMDEVGRICINYKDAIFLIQGLFIGNWGEMHSSKYAGEETIKKLYRAYRLGPMGELYLSVRTVSQLKLLLEESEHLRSVLDYDGRLTEEMKKSVSKVGLFDDAIMYGEDDMGTYRDYERDEALSYIGKNCIKVPVGGEALSSDEELYPEDVVDILKKMRLNYLNSQHDKALLNRWKHTEYKGGMLYDYIEAHMGYVLFVSEVNFDKKENKLSVYIKNLGFGSLVETTDLRIYIKRVSKTDAGETYSNEQRLDRRISHGSIVPEQTYTAVLPIHDLPRGRYIIDMQLIRLKDGKIIDFINPNQDELKKIPFSK